VCGRYNELLEDERIARGRSVEEKQLRARHFQEDTNLMEVDAGELSSSSSSSSSPAAVVVVAVAIAVVPSPSPSSLPFVVVVVVVVVVRLVLCPLLLRSPAAVP
jgi:hypothetical protein